MEKDPCSFWYEGELKFFDSYVIPMAKKLQDCAVFGVASDECLNYAMDNRKEWASKGQAILGELVANYQMREQEEEAAKEQADTVTKSPAPASKKKTRFARRRSLFTAGG
jgi:hypothetical protein